LLCHGPWVTIGSGVMRGIVMNRPSSLPSVVARALFAAVAALTLGTAVNISAQSAATSADEAAATSAPSDQPRRGRDRRRNAEQRPAADARPAATSAASADTDDSAEGTVVCKNIKLTGTKVARRICGTPEQWAAMQKRTSDAAEETMRQARDRQTTITQQPTPALSPGN
jgi:hypothetical protein